MATTPQRVYRAACPHCGAPVEFASAASAGAVCSFCRSTLVREGEALRRMGVSAELFDDHSPLQLGARGMRQGVAFTLVGRLQYGYEGGSWNEWHALFDNGPNGQRSAWLSEDNGAYVIAFDAPLPADAPALDGLRAGQRVLADGRAWEVASVTRATLIAAQGELPNPPRLAGEFSVVDLRNSSHEVATLDDSEPAQLHWSSGRAVLLSELALSGLREDSAKTLSGRAFECPGCGAALQLKLATTQSLSCPQCQSVVDVSAGVGADMAHYQQNNSGVGARAPQIALGTVGTLGLGEGPLPWQIVGTLERCDIPTDAEEETSFWREYLLYNATRGFAFLVDSNEGWSWVRPLTGTPLLRGNAASHNGVAYRQQFSYAAKVLWVQGEFYWRVRRDERAQVTDYIGTGAHTEARLSSEKTPTELTWSAGATLNASQIADAFGIAPAARAALQRDAAPLSGGASGASKALFIIFAVFVVVVLLAQCSGDDCDSVRSTFGAASTEYQQCQRNAGSGIRSSGSGGGSFGGWSSGGGGHK